MQRKWATVAAAGVFVIVLSVSIYYSPYIILSEASFLAANYLFFSVIVVVMATGIARKRHRTLVVLGGILCVIVFVAIQEIALVPDHLNLAFWLSETLTLGYSASFLFLVLRKPRIKWPDDV